MCYVFKKNTPGTLEDVELFIYSVLSLRSQHGCQCSYPVFVALLLTVLPLHASLICFGAGTEEKKADLCLSFWQHSRSGDSGRMIECQHGRTHINKPCLHTRNGPRLGCHSSLYCLSSLPRLPRSKLVWDLVLSPKRFN